MAGYDVGTFTDTSSVRIILRTFLSCTKIKTERMTGVIVRVKVKFYYLKRQVHFDDYKNNIEFITYIMEINFFVKIPERSVPFK